MSKIKIAFFADVLIRNYDGCNRTIFHIIDRYDQDKYDIKFFSSVFPETFPYKKFEIPSMTFPFNKKYKMALPQISSQKLDKALADFAPDVIHITTPSPLGFHALNYGQEKNIPVSTIYHTHYISYVDYYLRAIPFAIPLAKGKFINWTKNFYESCSVVLTPTQSIKNELMDYNIDGSNMTLWPRGIDKEVFNPLQADKHYLQKITKNTNPNILFASRLVWEKNIRTLINLYQQVEKENKAYNIVIAGDGVAMNDMKAEMPNATFLGNLSQKELAKVYASSDIFMFPSISETFGNVVIEAMASGLPCVIANGGGSKEFITPGENGYLCEPNDADDYLSKIDLILNDTNLKSKIKINGLKYTKALNWDQLVLDLCQEWKELKQVDKSQVLIAA